MSQYRQYEREKLNGTPVMFQTAAQRRKLIGRRIEWHQKGWLSKKSGTVEEVVWKNVLVSGNWEWAPDMLNVHVLEEDSK